MKPNLPTVLMLAPLPPPYAGPEVLTDSLLRSSLAGQFHLQVVNTTLNRTNRERGHLRPANIFRLTAICFKAIWSILRFRPRMTYMTLSQNKAGCLRDFLLFSLLKAARQKVVLHFHGGNLHVFYAHSPRWLQWFLRILLKNADCIIVLGPRIARRFNFVSFPVPTRVVLNWADEPGRQGIPHVKEPRNRPPAELVTVLSLGTISVAKGSADLLHAAAAVLASTRAVRFLFAGEIVSHEKNVLFDEDGAPLQPEPLAQLVQEMCAKFPGNIAFLGTVGPRRKWELLGEADILVAASYTEGFSVSVVEAMASTLPLICTPVGAIPDLLQPDVNAKFVTPGDRAGLARALLALIGDPRQRSAMGRANYNLYHEKLGPEKAATAIGKIFADVIAGRIRPDAGCPR